MNLHINHTSCTLCGTSWSPRYLSCSSKLNLAKTTAQATAKILAVLALQASAEISAIFWLAEATYFRGPRALSLKCPLVQSLAMLQVALARMDGQASAVTVRFTVFAIFRRND